MIELKTSKSEFVAMDMDDIEGIEKELQIHGHDERLTEREFQEYFQRILIRNTLICKLSEATEEDGKLIVDEFQFGTKSNPHLMFCNYIEDRYNLASSLESLYSLLKSKGIDVNNGNWYLFKKLKCHELQN